MHCAISILIGSALLNTTEALQDAPAAGAAKQESSNPAGPPQDKKVDSSRALELQKRIHEMRMNVLLGGDKVRQAETEAIDFYNRQSGLVEQRIDSMETDLVTKRAEYEVALDGALRSADPAARAQATRKAMGSSAEIGELEQELERMKGKRTGVSRLVATVSARKRDRENLAAEIETSDGLAGIEFGLPLMAVGFAPAAESGAGASPFDDERVVNDLMSRDPRAAKALLFEANPARYWERFRLQPPAVPLVKALSFPPPDVPGQR